MAVGVPGPGYWSTVGVGVGVEPGPRVDVGVGVTVGVPGSGVRVGVGVNRDVAEGDGDAVGIDVAVIVPGPGVEVAVGMADASPVGVMVGVPPGPGVPGGVAWPVAVAVLPGGTTGTPGVVAPAGNPPEGTPLATRGFGWTILITSKNHALPSGAAFPQPSGPSYRRNIPSTVIDKPLSSILIARSKPVASSRSSSEIKAHSIAGPLYGTQSGKGALRREPLTRINRSLKASGSSCSCENVTS